MFYHNAISEKINSAINICFIKNVVYIHIYILFVCILDGEGILSFWTDVSPWHLGVGAIQRENYYTNITRWLSIPSSQNLSNLDTQIRHSLYPSEENKTLINQWNIFLETSSMVLRKVIVLKYIPEYLFVSSNTGCHGN